MSDGKINIDQINRAFMKGYEVTVIINGEYYDYEVPGMKYIDERGYVYTREQLRNSFWQLKSNGETEANNFQDYLTNCLGKNGTLSLKLE